MESGKTTLLTIFAIGLIPHVIWFLTPPSWLDLAAPHAVAVLPNFSLLWANIKIAVGHLTVIGFGIVVRFVGTLDSWEASAQIRLDKYHESIGRSCTRGTVRYYLYANERNSSDRVELTMDDYSSLATSEYNISLPLILIVHGFLENTLQSDSSATVIKTAYFDTGFASRANIILVDWSDLFCVHFPVDRTSTEFLMLLMWYYIHGAAAATRAIEPLAQFFQKMYYDNMFVVSDTRVVEAHLVGHSLGAHIVGLAAQKFTKSTGLIMKRITGSDPAGPFFHYVSPTERLSSGHAEFVDVVHTNAGEFGISGNTGRVDYHVNGGGMFQSVCTSSQDYLPMDSSPSCSHGLAFVYFATSIRNQSIYGECIGTCHHQRVTFGQGISSRASGAYEVTL